MASTRAWWLEPTSPCYPSPVRARVTLPLVILASGTLYLLFLQDLLLDWDPVQFALALEHFSMPMHQPHPPGYFGFLSVAYILGWLGLPSDQAVRAASLFFTALSAGALYLVGARLFDRGVGLFSAVAFATHPVTIYYAVSGESYPTEPLLACLLMMLACGASKGAFFFALGLSGGFRQGLMVYFAPVAVLVFARQVKGLAGTLKHLARCTGAFAAGLALWLPATVALAGGMGQWVRASKGQHLALFAASFSPLFGAPAQMSLQNLDELLHCLLSIAIPLLPVVLALLPLALRHGVALAFVGNWAVLALSFIGPTLYFALMWISKPGYLLVVTPALTLASAAVVNRAIPRLAPLVLAGIAFFQLALFLAPPFTWAAYVSPCTLPAMEYQQEVARDALSSIKGLGGGDSVAVVTRYGGGLSFRAAMYNLPEYHVYWLVDHESTGAPLTGADICEGHHHEVSCVSGLAFYEQTDLLDTAVVRLPEGTRRIVWVGQGPFFQALAKATKLEEVPAGRSGVLLVSEVGPGGFKLAVGPYVFER